MQPAAALNREVIHQILPQHASGVADALRMGRSLEFSRMRVDSSAPAATTTTRAYGFAMLVRDPVDVVNALGPAAAVHH